MNKISIYSFILLMMCNFSCTKDFEDINNNPNAPVAVHPSLLLRQVIFNVGEEMSYEAFVAGNLLGQYFTAIDFNLFDRHSLTEPQFGGNPWPVLYQNLRDNQIILDLVDTNPNFEVYRGPALILKTYLAAMLTDLYGDVPYFDAVQGKSDNVTPKYDDQSDIYQLPNGLMDNLDQAIMAIDNYTGIQHLDGDFMYNGDLVSWRKFAVSLKLKYLMRISNKVDISDELKTINISQDLIIDNSQNATFDFKNEPPNNFRMANLRAGDFNLFVMSETIEDILEELNDNRAERFFRPTGNNMETYQGLLNGPDASATSISVSDYSLTGTIFREETALLDANFITASEVHFLLSEAIEKGYLEGDAALHYNIGVELSFEYWNVNLPVSYLESGPANYLITNSLPLDKIATQKWIHNINNPYEGWIEYRRLTYPVLKQIDASLNNNLIPVRMPYPADEASLNTIHYNEATLNNDNSINFPVWWDEN